MKLTAVSSGKTRRDFLKVPRILYKKDPFWVCPLDQDTVNAFDPAKNKLFKQGNARRWILYNDSNRLIGRIAAFYNMDLSARNKQATGGIGWFECINDQGAANMHGSLGRSCSFRYQ